MNLVRKYLPLVVLGFGIVSNAQGQDYPTKNVTIVVPYPAGGPTDQLARQIAQKLAEQLGGTFIVEDVTGGATTIGTGRVARAAPDGHTLLLHNLQIAANPALYPKLPYDTASDLTTVAFVNRNPLVLAGRKDLPPSTLKELLAYMKRTTASVATPGAGSTGDLSITLLEQIAGLKVLHVPYRGAAPMVQDVLGGQVDLTFATPQQMAPLVAAGRIKAFGLTQKETLAQFPAAGSLVAELGPKLDVQYWTALFTRAGTPKAVIEKLNRVVQAFVDEPAIVRSWAEIGVAPYSKEERTPEGGEALFKSEIERWGAVVRDNNIQPAQ
jgi:tripartite-type tricarboxylate transporter receptor subunit TctC